MRNGNMAYKDRRRPRAGVFAREGHDVFYRQTADGRGFLRRIVLHPLAQRVKSQGMALDIISVVKAFVDDHVHHAQRQRGIGARQRRQVLIAFRRRQAAIGIDRNDSGAAAFRLLHARP